MRVVDFSNSSFEVKMFQMTFQSILIHLNPFPLYSTRVRPISSCRTCLWTLTTCASRGSPSSPCTTSGRALSSRGTTTTRWAVSRARSSCANVEPRTVVVGYCKVTFCRLKINFITYDIILVSKLTLKEKEL